MHRRLLQPIVGSSVACAFVLVACGQSGQDADGGNSGGSSGEANVGLAGAAGDSSSAGGAPNDASPDGSTPDASPDASTPDGAAGSAQGGSGGGVVDGCTPSPPEICNYLDDDCNGLIDDVDFTLPASCGTCANDCLLHPQVLDASCTPPPTLDGKTPGTCTYTCALDFYDLSDSIKGCEYSCVWNPNGTTVVDGNLGTCGADDDCDGQIDEDVDLCSADNCGTCGKKCLIPHGIGACKKTTDSGVACSLLTTTCVIAQCDPGWKDENSFTVDGCETPTTDGG